MSRRRAEPVASPRPIDVPPVSTPVVGPIVSPVVSPVVSTKVASPTLDDVRRMQRLQEASLDAEQRWRRAPRNSGARRRFRNALLAEAAALRAMGETSEHVDALLVQLGVVTQSAPARTGSALASVAKGMESINGSGGRAALQRVELGAAAPHSNGAGTVRVGELEAELTAQGARLDRVRAELQAARSDIDRLTVELEGALAAACLPTESG
jgi:hypothetical protein